MEDIQIVIRCACIDFFNVNNKFSSFTVLKKPLFLHWFLESITCLMSNPWTNGSRFCFADKIIIHPQVALKNG